MPPRRLFLLFVLSQTIGHVPQSHALKRIICLPGSISRGGALAQCRGFGTCGWKGVGTPRRRPTCSWDPPPQRHGFNLHGLGATALRASAASHHTCGREELLRRWADSEIRPQGPARATLLEDGKAGPRAGLSRPGQPRRQPDASRSTLPAVPSLNLARAHETGSRTLRAGRRSVIAGPSWTPSPGGTITSAGHVP